jgi:hypothetical protein
VDKNERHYIGYRILITALYAFLMYLLVQAKLFLGQNLVSLNHVEHKDKEI